MKNLSSAAYRSWSLRPLSLTVAISLAINGALPAALADTGKHGVSAPSDAVDSLIPKQTFEVADDAAPPQNAPALSDKAAQENMFWESAQRSNSVADYKAYLDAFPTGLYAPLAKNRIAAMSAAPQPAAPQPVMQQPVATQPMAPQPLAQQPMAPQPMAQQPMAPQPYAGIPSAFGPPPPAVSPDALKSEIGTVETEQSLNMEPPQRMELQQRLSALGLYNGPVDGDLGPGAREAIAEWQKRHGVAPTGEIGPMQLAVLRMESEAAFQQMAAAPRPGPVYVAHPVYYAPRHIVHAYQPAAPSYAAPAVLGALGGLAIGLLGARLGGKFGGGGGGKGGHGGGGHGGGHGKKR